MCNFEYVNDIELTNQEKEDLFELFQEISGRSDGIENIIIMNEEAFVREALEDSSTSAWFVNYIVEANIDGVLNTTKNVKAKLMMNFLSSKYNLDNTGEVIRVLFNGLIAISYLN